MTLTGEQTKPYADKQTLRTLYEEDGKSVSELAAQLGCGESTIRRYLRAFGIWESENGTVSFYTGEHGYEYLQVDQYYFRLHRLLIIAKRGLDALDGDSVVHHETRIPWDNRPDKLRVFSSQSAHSRHHAQPDIDEDQELLDSYPTVDEQGDSRQYHDRRPQQTTLLSFQEDSDSDE